MEHCNNTVLHVLSRSRPCGVTPDAETGDLVAWGVAIPDTATGEKNPGK